MTKRYQREVIRFRISKKNRQHNGHKIPKRRLSDSVYQRRTDNTMATRYQREVIRFRISKKNRQHNGHKIPKGGNQILYIKEEQTTQWPQDTKGRLSDSVYRRRTDSTMTKRKSTKKQTTIYKTYT
jgi:hypothetical protein